MSSVSTQYMLQFGNFSRSVSKVITLQSCAEILKCEFADKIKLTVTHLQDMKHKKYIEYTYEIWYVTSKHISNQFIEVLCKLEMVPQVTFRHFVYFTWNDPSAILKWRLQRLCPHCQTSTLMNIDSRHVTYMNPPWFSGHWSAHRITHSKWTKSA